MSNSDQDRNSSLAQPKKYTAVNFHVLMRVFLRTETGEVITLQTSATTTVGDLKQAALDCGRSKLPAPQSLLFDRATPLYDEEKLVDHLCKPVEGTPNTWLWLAERAEVAETPGNEVLSVAPTPNAVDVDVETGIVLVFAVPPQELQQRGGDLQRPCYTMDKIASAVSLRGPCDTLVAAQVTFCRPPGGECAIDVNVLAGSVCGASAPSSQSNEMLQCLTLYADVRSKMTSGDHALAAATMRTTLTPRFPLDPLTSYTLAVNIAALFGRSCKSHNYVAAFTTGACPAVRVLLRERPQPGSPATRDMLVTLARASGGLYGELVTAIASRSGYAVNRIGRIAATARARSKANGGGAAAGVGVAADGAAAAPRSRWEITSSNGCLKLCHGDLVEFDQLSQDEAAPTVIRNDGAAEQSRGDYLKANYGENATLT